MVPLLSSVPPLSLPSVSDTLIRVLLGKQARGEDCIPLVWRCIVRDELSRCARNVERLSFRERSAACDLLDLCISSDCKLIDESWLNLYRREEQDYRMTRSLLFYYARHVVELSARERIIVMDICEDFFQRYREYHSAWSAIYSN